MKASHVVPLAKQALAIIEDLRLPTGGGRFLFPSLRTPARCMSENAITAALRRLGYSGEEMTWHGFRAMASTRTSSGFRRTSSSYSSRTKSGTR